MLTYCATLVVRFAAMLMPWPVLRTIGKAAGLLAFRLDGRHRRMAVEAISRCFPEKSPDDHFRLARGCYRHLGISVMEFARMASLPRAKVLQSWGPTDEQNRQLDALAAEHPAPIFLTGHLGFWEMCGLGHTARGGRLSSLARPLRNPRIDGLVKAVRERFGSKVLSGPGALTAVMRNLREGIPVSMLLDQDAGAEGVFVPLFGRPASTRPTAAQVALKTGSAIVCIATWRDEHDGVHRLRIGKVIRPGRWRGPRDKAFEETVRRIVTEYTAEIEIAIRQHPEQWLWIQRRWKTPPPQGQAQ